MAMIGIDLGTTNSVVAYFDEHAKLIKNTAERFMTPSVISLDPKLGLLVGEAAKRRQITHSDKTVARFKRFIGSDKVVRLGKKEFSAVDLSAMVLKTLKQDAETALNTTVDAAVISVPAYFNAVQRQATKDAAHLAGLRVERLINEPTAAALAYGLNNSGDVSKVIVLDLGGGTFDVSLIEIFDGVIEVHASAGDALLGGEDFTDIIARHLAKDSGKSWTDLDAEKRQYFYGLAEIFKLRLSDQNSVSLGVSFEGHEKTITITQEELETLCGQLLLRMRRPIDKCLYDSDTSVADVDRVVLVGGATRMPMVRSMVSRIFRQLPVRSIDPDHVVALGAAVQAGLAQNDQALNDIVMTDVTPFSMGLATHNYQAPNDPHRLLFEPLISRNTTLPCSREGFFSTVSNNQTHILLQIYQGEAAYARDNVKLGEIKVPVPPGPEGKEGVTVRFTYDTSGLLDVDAQVVSTGVKHNILIKGDAEALSKEEIAERLKILSGIKRHPRESEKNQILLETLKQLCELLLGRDREYAMNLLIQFETALDSQDADLIAKTAEEITPQIHNLEAQYGRF